MIKDDILQFLMKNTKAENYYLTHPNTLGKSYKHIKKVDFEGQEVYKFELPNLKLKVVQIRKDSRYTFVPKYIHTNINLNYILRGQCTYVVDRTKFIMHEGDVCLFDTDVIREKERLGANDLVINISLSNDFFSNDFINKIQSKEVIYNWLLSSLSFKSLNHDNFILFRNHQNIDIESTFEAIINEYYGQDHSSITIINSLLLIIFIELIRQQDKRPDSLIRIHNTYLDDKKIGVMTYVSEHLGDELSQMAAHLGYSEVYLSKLIKHYFGIGLSTLKQQKKLDIFTQELIYSDKSINEIISQLGITNKNYLFKQFEGKYGTTPRKYRIQQKNK